jgi:DNA-binding transcriptional LysR family regulator
MEFYAHWMCMDAHFGNWDEIRTAWMVARHGSLTAAGEALGVHHATVLRHVNALESRLGVRLFQRHSRGYTPTDAGKTLLEVATATAEQFDLLPYRLRNTDTAISGKLIVTTLPELAEGLVSLLGRFHRDYPDTQIELLADNRLLRLEYGEAHISVRVGPPPREPDNIARPLGQISVTFFANADYIERFGQPTRRDDISGHRYISLLGADRRNQPAVWIDENVPQEQVVFRGGTIQSLRAAAESGMGIAPLVSWRLLPETELIELFPPPDDWRVPLWLVTHRDNHRSPKVKAVHSYILREFTEAT